jgi:hypothetical protein
LNILRSFCVYFCYSLVINDEKDAQTLYGPRKINIENIAAKIFIQQDFVSEHSRLLWTLMAWKNLCWNWLWLLLNQYGRLFLLFARCSLVPTILFNPSLSQHTVLHRFSSCTLDTIVPNPKSNPLNIRKYFVFTEKYGVHFGHGKTFCRKKTRVKCKKNRVSAELYYSHPNPIFFLDKQFCSVLNGVHWTRIRRSWSF